MKVFLAYPEGRPEISGLATAKKMKQFVVDFYPPDSVSINNFCQEYNCTPLQISATNKGNIYMLMRWND